MGAASLDNPLGLTFHHLGLAVYHPKKAMRFLSELGYTLGESVVDSLQNVQLIMCHCASMPDVEIIYPAGPEGPLDNILKVRSELIYHVCYQTHSLEAFFKNMRDRRIAFKAVSSPKPAVLFNQQPVSFYVVPGFGLIEILECATHPTGS